MTIAFVHNGISFLPEVDAYISYFRNYPEIKTMVLKAAEVREAKADVEWHFLGTHFKRSEGSVLIHEYASASIAPFAGLKNTIKRRFNCVPDYRIFSNEYVRDQFSFNDEIGYGFRSHGVTRDALMTSHDAQKDYDFIYVGNIAKERRLDALFDCFAEGRMKGRRLLVLSDHYGDLQKKFSPYPNIHFQGPVRFDEVYKYIVRAKYAFNYIPNREPFNKQVPSKFLDYAACDIPVVTTDYEWIRKFEQRYGGKYFYLNEDLSNLDWDEISHFEFSTPDLTGWYWEKQIEGSGVIQFLQKEYPEIF